eukprot:11253884-Alexandrium_andersonii.AAC.1
MPNRFRRSNLELRGPENDPKFQPRRPRPGGPVPFCALSPMAATKQAGGRAGGASLGRRRKVVSEGSLEVPAGSSGFQRVPAGSS